MRAIDEVLADEWQPIETAPHDRLVLLFCASRDMHVGGWVQNPWTGNEAFEIADLGEQGRVIVHPTYWRELPEPPHA